MIQTLAARFAGLDVHKAIVVACILDALGKVLLRLQFPCTREALLDFARRHLTLRDKVVVESTTNTWATVELLRPLVGEVVVSNPYRTKAIAFAKVKTDKVDAHVLAQLLRLDFLPRVWEPPAAVLELRRRTGRRSGLVAGRTALKNRVHAVLHQRIIPEPEGKCFTPDGLAWLKKVDLDQEGREALDSDLRLLDNFNDEIALMDQTLARQAAADPRVKLLITLPGCDVAVITSLLAAWGDVSRFPDADHAASYLGLVPRTRQSGEHLYHGPITKEGRGHTRWLLVQAAQSLDTNPGPLGVFFRRLAQKKGRNVAVVATARKLAVIAWHMLVNNEPYRYAQPALTKIKLSRLRLRAGGPPLPRGHKKGTKLPAFGTGQRTKAIPALAEVYAQAQLPAAKTPDAVSRGERRVLQEMGVAGFVQNIQTAQRLIIKPGKKKQEGL